MGLPPLALSPNQWINPSGIFPSHSWLGQCWCSVNTREKLALFSATWGGVCLACWAICSSSFCQPRISLSLWPPWQFLFLHSLCLSLHGLFHFIPFQKAAGSISNSLLTHLLKMKLSVQYFKPTEMQYFGINRSTTYISATYQLSDIGQEALPLWALIFSSTEWT